MLLDANSIVAGNGGHSPQYYIPAGADAGTQVYSTLYNTSYDRPWSAYFIIRKNNIWEIYSGFAGNFGPKSYTRIYHTQDAFPTVTSGGRVARSGARPVAGTTGTRPPENATWVNDADNSAVVLNLTGVSEPYIPPTNSLTLVASASPDPACVDGSIALSVTASGGTSPYSYTWTIPEGTLITGGTGNASSVTATATTSGVKTFTVTVQDASGSPASTTTVDVSVIALPVVSIGANPGLSINAGSSSLLTASGATSYSWSTGATSSAITASTNGIYSVTGTSGGCSATASVSLSVGVDLTPTITLPTANFTNSAPGSTRTFTIGIFEGSGQATASGAIVVTITIPLGYSIAFNSTLTATDVTGGANNPVPVNNTQWDKVALTETQLTLIMKPGQAIAPNGNSIIGLSLSRYGASKGTANITVNVNDDAAKTYDSNAANNVFAININAL